MPEPNEIDFSAFRDDLDEIAVAITNRIDREARPEAEQYHSGLPALLILNVKVSHATHRAIRYLCADRPPDPARRAEFAIAVTPLSRTILDSLFLILSILECPGKYCDWYYASGWKTAKDELERLKASHGTDPDWAEYLGQYEKSVDDQERGIAEKYRKQPETIKWWPAPGKMLTQKRAGNIPLIADGARKNFFRMMYDNYYGRLSEDSHLHYGGMARRGGHLSAYVPRSEQLERLDIVRQQSVLEATALLVTLLSEIAFYFDLRHEKKRVQGIWDHLSNYPAGKEIFDFRYRFWGATK